MSFSQVMVVILHLLGYLSRCFGPSKLVSTQKLPYMQKSLRLWAIPDGGFPLRWVASTRRRGPSHQREHCRGAMWESALKVATADGWQGSFSQHDPGMNKLAPARYVSVGPWGLTGLCTGKHNNLRGPIVYGFEYRGTGPALVKPSW